MESVKKFPDVRKTEIAKSTKPADLTTLVSWNANLCVENGLHAEEMLVRFSSFSNDLSPSKSSITNSTKLQLQNAVPKTTLPNVNANLDFSETLMMTVWDANRLNVIAMRNVLQTKFVVTTSAKWPAEHPTLVRSLQFVFRTTVRFNFTCTRNSVFIINAKIIFYRFGSLSMSTWIYWKST